MSIYQTHWDNESTAINTILAAKEYTLQDQLALLVRSRKHCQVLSPAFPILSRRINQLVEKLLGDL